jgi:sugar phosphate isomerase/epimerase
MKLSLFSVGYAGFWGQHQLDIPQFISQAADLEYDAVMLAAKRPHLSVLDATHSQVDRIKNHLKQKGIQCAVLAGYTDFSGAGAAEVPFLEMQIAYVESLAKLASELGAGIIRVFTAYETEQHPLERVWNRVVTSLRECSDRAAEYSVRIAIQNHHDIGVHSDSLLELLHDIDRPNCKLGFDAWSPALRGEDIYETAKRMAPYTVCTTNADYVRLPRFRYQPESVNYLPARPDMVRAVPFGDGFIDYEAFFAGLKEGGFDGIATYEMCSPLRGGGSLDNLNFCASRYLNWMKEHVL